ncbi:MAG: hypothetical protein ACK4UU_07815, partial [Fimbriimonadales bacterium]
MFVTDSYGTQTRFCFQVWVGNPDAAADGQLLRATEGASLTGDWENGWNASIEWFAGLADVLPGTRITIFTLHTYGDGTSETTVDFVGYLQDDAAMTAGDETAGQLQSLRVQAYGFASILGRLRGATARVTRRQSPAAWGDIASPTPARVLTYALAWHTTAFNLCSFSWWSGDAAHETDDVDVHHAHILDMMVDFLSRYNAEPTFAPSGEIRCARNACYLPIADRAALPTIITLGTQDVQSVQIDRQHMPTAGSILLPAICYDTAKGTTVAYTAKAPAVTAYHSGEEQTGPNQVLPADLTDAQIRAEISQRAANHFAYINNRYTLTLDLLDSYSDLTPSNDRWFVLDLPAADNPIGQTFSTQRWLLKEIRIDVTSPDGVRSVSATFIAETSDVGAQILVTQLPTEVSMPLAPPSAPFGDIDQPWLGDPADFPLRS